MKPSHQLDERTQKEPTTLEAVNSNSGDNDNRTASLYQVLNHEKTNIDIHPAVLELQTFRKAEKEYFTWLDWYQPVYDPKEDPVVRLLQAALLIVALILGIYQLAKPLLEQWL